MTGHTRRLRQVCDVLVDLPVFLTSPIYRWWHLRWGATIGEVRASMAGDGRHPNAPFRATRAITISAPPQLVWPWLVQMGCLLGVVLMEFGDFAMNRRMMRGIKTRAESP